MLIGRVERGEQRGGASGKGGTCPGVSQEASGRGGSHPAIKQAAEARPPRRASRILEFRAGYGTSRRLETRLRQDSKYRQGSIT